VTRKTPVNLPVSVHHRLRNWARERNRPVAVVLQHYALERFLYRLSQSPHADRFDLKGASMFRVWGGHTARPTRDVDLLGRGANDVASVVSAIRDICTCDVIPDGLEFEPATVQGSVIAEDAEYHGVRVALWAFMGKTRIRMQIDVGFGDVAFPPPEEIEYPTHLAFPAPRLRGYRPETVIAEKLQVMVVRRTANSRMKDFYDIWALSSEFGFDAAVISQAVAKTFSNRGTALPAGFSALVDELKSDPQKPIDWINFCRGLEIVDAPAQFSDAMEAIELFLGPIVEAVAERREFTAKWAPPGPWVRR